MFKNLPIFPVLIFFCISAGFLFYSSTPEGKGYNYSSPEKALKSLEKAYINNDIESAVRAKDFNYEALEMLKVIKKIRSPDQGTVNDTAEVLELSFRKDLKTNGFPDFRNLHCVVTESRKVNDKLVRMVERCLLPDMNTSLDIMYAVNDGNSWKIVTMPDELN